MKTQKLLAFVSVLALGLTALPALAVEGIDDDDHAALAVYYDNIAKEAEVKLQVSKSALEEYEAHPYYYGRQGQDFKSHTVANIREYEETLTESLHNADLHKKIAIEAVDHDNSTINKARANFDQGTSVIR